MKNVLTSAGAAEYIPLFARHRISIETLRTLTESDLSQMGVHELGLRRAIIKNIDAMEMEKGKNTDIKPKVKVCLRGVRFGHKFGQIGTKWDQFMTF